MIVNVFNSYDDPSIISISSSTIMGATNSRQSYRHEEAPSKIEPPPGLAHPSKLQQQANKEAVAKANEVITNYSNRTHAFLVTFANTLIERSLY